MVRNWQTAQHLGQRDEGRIQYQLKTLPDPMSIDNIMRGTDGKERFPIGEESKTRVHRFQNKGQES